MNKKEKIEELIQKRNNIESQINQLHDDLKFHDNIYKNIKVLSPISLAILLGIYFIRTTQGVSDFGIPFAMGMITSAWMFSFVNHMNTNVTKHTQVSKLIEERMKITNELREL